MLALVAALVLTQNEAWVSSARELLGVKYEFGGRLRKSEGIDCLGVVLAAAEKVTGCGWRGYSVNPTELVKAHTLGGVVETHSPVKSEHVDLATMQPGDIVMLLSPIQNPAEGPIAELEGTALWVWHVGIASGGGQWIVGDHYAGEVIETDLAKYLTDHRDGYSAVFVVRPSGQKPERCRKHAPMSVTRSTPKRQK